MVIRDSHWALGSLLSSLLPLVPLAPLWATDPHLRQPSSSESGVKRARELSEQSAAGTAVMWDSQNECNIISSGAGIIYNKLRKHSQNVCFFPEMHSSKEKSQQEKMILAETIHPMRGRKDSQTRQSQTSVQWSQKRFKLAWSYNLVWCIKWWHLCLSCTLSHFLYFYKRQQSLLEIETSAEAP